MECLPEICQSTEENFEKPQSGYCVSRPVVELGTSQIQIGRDSVIGIETGYGVDGPGIESR
jgi:hypothetical protein